MWGVAWQLPQGNTTYATCDGSDGHAMDGVTELLLDTYPANKVAQRMAASGCAMWIFSLGGAGANVCDDKKDGITNPTPHAGNKGLKSLFADDDGGYLRLKGGEYFRNPVPILGKPVAQAGKRKAGAADKPAEDPTAKPVVKAEPRAMPKLADKALLDPWSQRLHDAVVAAVAARREPQFAISSLHAKGTLRDLQPDGTMVVSIAGSGELTASWTSLTPADQAALAVAMLRGTEPAPQALAAFFLLLSGDEERGRERLAMAGAEAEAIASAFGLARPQ
jgi:hypothetical protein